MKTLSLRAIALAAIVFCSISANAQRQSKLYIDDGHGSFETLSATLGGGSLTFPGGAAGTLLTTGNPTMITGVGIVTAGTWDGGVIQPIYGGTGLNSYVQGNILYASAANTLSALPPITNDGWVLTWNNSTTLPEWRVASGGGGSGWSLTGNSGTTPGTDFLGTTDPKDLVIQTNGHEAMRVTSGDSIGIGTTTPIAQFDVAGNVPSSSTGNLNLGSSSIPESITIRGRYAYIADAYSKLSIFDVSNPASPVSVGSTSTGVSGPQGPQSLCVQGNYGYIANQSNNTLGVFDISNPASPTFLGSCAAGANQPWGVCVASHYAYIALPDNAEVGICDISNPSAPVHLSNLSIGSAPGPYTVYIADNLLYVPNYQNGVKIYSLVNPASPSLVGTISTGSTYPQYIYVSGSYAYVVQQFAVGIYDISNPASPSTVATISLGTNYPSNIIVAGRYAYIVASSIQGGYDVSGSLLVYDISNPALPISVGAFTIAGPGFITGAVNGRYAYLIGSNGSTANFITADLGGTYSQSLESGTLETGLLQVHNDMAIGGDVSSLGTVSGTNGNFQSLTVNGGSFVQRVETVTPGGTLDGLANIYYMSSAATTTTSAPSSVSAEVIYVYNGSGNSQTIAGTSVPNAETATLVYFPVGWKVAGLH